MVHEDLIRAIRDDMMYVKTAIENFEKRIEKLEDEIQDLKDGWWNYTTKK
jgi:polyhydroxyalkanoate synthesis regulator phasin